MSSHEHDWREMHPAALIELADVCARHAQRVRCHSSSMAPSVFRKRSALPNTRCSPIVPAAKTGTNCASHTPHRSVGSLKETPHTRHAEVGSWRMRLRGLQHHAHRDQCRQVCHRAVPRRRCPKLDNAARLRHTPHPLQPGARVLPQAMHLPAPHRSALAMQVVLRRLIRCQTLKADNHARVASQAARFARRRGRRIGERCGRAEQGARGERL